MSYQFAGIDAVRLGEHHLFRRLTAERVINFVQFAVTDPDACLLCGGTAGSDCASLTRNRCLKPNGDWRLPRQMLRKIENELYQLSARTYEHQLARALDVPPAGVIVHFIPDSPQGDMIRDVIGVVWKGGFKGDFAERGWPMLPGACGVLPVRMPSRGELLTAVATMEQCLFGMSLPMLTAIDDPSPWVNPFDDMGPWRDFIFDEKAIGAWCAHLLQEGEPPRNVTTAECEAALTSFKSSAEVRALAWELLGRLPSAGVPAAASKVPKAGNPRVSTRS